MIRVLAAFAAGVVLIILPRQGTCFAEAPRLGEAVIQLSSDNSRKRRDAAELLATIRDPKVVPSLRKQLAEESDFHVRLALNYAIAAHGNRSNLQVLIDALSRTGHLGVVYLRRATGQDFNWDRSGWQRWFDDTTDDAFATFIKRRWERKPIMDEFSRFSSLFGARAFGRVTEFDEKEDRFVHRPLSDDEERELSSLPTAKAWALFQSAIRLLQEKGDRAEAARLLHQIAKTYPDTYYADTSAELAVLLDQMVKEDKEFTAPDAIDDLPLERQVEVHIHNLRDVVAHQFAQPGHCLIFSQLRFGDDQRYNAAFALRDIGEPAVPYLVELLEDRRPIRAVGYWRNFHPTRTVLRYQDAAIEIINEIRPEQPYRRRTTSSYFSVEKPPVREKIIADLRRSISEAPSNEGTTERSDEREPE